MIRYQHFIFRIIIYVQKLIFNFVSPPMFIRSGLLLEGYFIKGPSKNYVLRGGRGSTILLYIYSEGQGGILWNILRNARYSIWELKEPYLVSFLHCEIIKRKNVDEISVPITLLPRLKVHPV